MALEDFQNDYTESDPENRLSLSDDFHVAINNQDRDGDDWFVQDAGAGFLSSTDRPEWTAYARHRYISNGGGICMVGVLGDTLDDYDDVRTGGVGRQLSSAIRRNTLAGGGQHYLWLVEIFAGTFTSDSSISLSSWLGNWFRLKFRISEAGTYGTAIIDIYDETETTLLDTISVALTGDHSWRYKFGVQSGDLNDNWGINGDFRDWEISWTPGGGPGTRSRFAKPQLVRGGIYG